MVFTSKESFVTSALRRRYSALAILVVGIVWLGVALALYPLRDADGRYALGPYGWSTATEDIALDLLFQLRDVYRPWFRTSARSWPITIIEIDEESLAASEKMPEAWRRSNLYARLINRANDGGASVIGLDIFLSEPSGDSPEDAAYDEELAKTIKDTGRVVIVNKLKAGGTAANTPLSKFSEAAYLVGFADVAADSDEFVRHVPLEIFELGEGEQFSFATRLAAGYLTAKNADAESGEQLKDVDEKTASLGDRVLPLRNDRDLQLDFRGRPHAFEHVSAKDILFNQRQISDDLFRDRIVLIGPAYITAPDQFPTPFFEPSALTRFLDWSLPTAPARTTGVEIHATTIGTILFGQSPVRPRYLWQVIFLIFPLALVGVAVFRLPLKLGLPSLILLAIATLAVSSWAFNAKGWIMPLASAWVGMAVLTPLGFGLRYVRERILHDQTQAERAHVRDILSRCVSKEVADELWQRRDKIMSGERRIVSIIFTDIRGFTTLSETASSDQVVIWLNEYFSRMQSIVTHHCGHINKFLGDGLMIVFGAPISRGDEAEARAAVACGLEMLTEVERLNVDWQGTGRPEIKIGVGITTGDATCGVVGAERRLEYTVIGDVVNLSSRLEATTKEYGVPLLASEATALLLGDEYETQALGEVKVKGKNIQTKIFTVNLRVAKVETVAPVAVTH
jgi:adenylate cyclase